MVQHRSFLVSTCLMVCMAAAAKDKKKIILPADVLRAETVLVVVDPDAGDAIDAPMANRNARNAVETALLDWRRFRLAMNTADADLVISVRKGNGKPAQPTIGGLPDNDRPVIVTPSETGPRIGGTTGHSAPIDPGSGVSVAGPASADGGWRFAGHVPGVPRSA